MRRLRPYLPTIIPLLGFLILPTLLYFDVTIGSKTMLPIDNLYEWAPWAASAAELGVGSPHNGLISDMILQNVVWKQYVRETILAGDIPLWNPHLFAGVPFLAAGQHSAYYPFSWLFFVMPLTKAYGWYALSQVWLAGVFMYVYGRVLNLSRPSAFIAGLVFQGCGTLIISAAVFPMVSGAIVWLPLLLACIERGIGDWGSGAGDRGLGIGDQKASNIPQFLWLGIGAVGLGMQILAGHIEYTIYTLLVMGLYAAWRLASVGILASRTGQPWRQRVLVPAFQLLGMVLVGLMLGGIQLVPLYELGQVNFRESSSTLEEIRFYGFQERRVITLAIPNFFGNPTHHDYRDPFTGEIIPFETNYEGQPKRDSAWGFKNHVEGAIYLGILPLILAGLAVVRLWRNGRIQFFVLLSLASLGFIFGTPLYGLLYYGLPFVNQLHTPFRWVFPLSVCVAVLAGYGVDWVLGIGDLGFGTGEQSTDNSQQSTSNKPLASRFSPLASRYLPLVTIFAGILVLGGLGVSLWQYGRFASLVERVFLGLALATTAFPSAEAFYGYQFWQLLIFGLMVLGSGIVLWLGNKGFKRPFILAAAFLIIADLFLAGRNFNTAVDASLLDHKPELVQWLEQQPGQWRITSFTPNGGAPLNANSGWFYGFEDIRGYDSIIPKQYTNYMATLEPQNGLIYNKIQPVGAHATLDSPLLDVLNVKYVITPDVIGPPKFEQVWEGAGLRIYENLGVAPRAYTLPQTSTVVSEDPLTDLRQYDPRQYAIVGGSSGIDDSRLTINENDPPIPNSYTPATMMHYSNREVIVEASVTSPSWLILNDSYFPGWNAFVTDISLSDSEEEQVDVHLVNGNFRGILLEEGDWSIRFRYSPSSFWLGGLASVMGAIILVFAGVVIGWQRFSGETSEQSMVQRLAKNSVAPMVLNLFNKGIDFAFALYYLRVLGPADTGSYQTAITTAVLFEIISNFGLDILLIRDVSQAREKSASYLLNSTVLRLGMGLIAAMPILLFIFGTRLIGDSSFTQAEIIATILIMSGMVFSGMSKGITGLFYVYEQAEVPATMATVTTILKVGFGVIVLLLGFSFVGLAAVSILVNIITLAALAAIALRRFAIQGPWRVDWPLQREMLVKGWPLMLIHLLQTVFISIDVVLLRLQLPTTGQTVVGWYSTAYKWFNALQIIPSFFTLALFPVISRELKNSFESARNMYQLSLKLMLLLALPISAVTFYLAYPLTRILSGEEFLPHGAIALQIVILSIPFGWLNSVTNYVLIGLGLEDKQPRAFAIAVGFNIITNLLFIPMFTYRAAAVTTILSELVLMGVFAYYLRTKMANVDWLGLLLRPLLLTAIMFGGLYLGGQLHMLVGLIFGAAIYLGGLFLFNIIGQQEKEVLASILPDPLARRLR